MSDQVQHRTTDLPLNVIMGSFHDHTLLEVDQALMNISCVCYFCYTIIITTIIAIMITSNTLAKG